MRPDKCKNGHILDDANTQVVNRSSGEIEHRCKACRNARRRELYRPDPERNRRARARLLELHPEYEKERYKKRAVEKCNWHRQDRIDNPDKHRNRELKRCYNITLEQYDDMLEAQDFKCAVCGTDTPGGKYNRFMVDHDHSCCPDKRNTCGKCVRGLVCSRCNLVLGEVDDSQEVLGQLIQYLQRYQNG